MNRKEKLGLAATTMSGGLFWGFVHSFENMDFVAICGLIAIGLLVSAVKGGATG